jgi:hypothetical protein
LRDLSNAALDAAAAVDDQHPLLVQIVAAVAEKGSHTQRWGALRQSLFPGENGWTQLKAWCETQSLDCQLCYGESSRAADVQFRKLPAR